jgi:alginate O-acetyltransferase complex protein AlgI
MILIRRAYPNSQSPWDYSAKTRPTGSSKARLWSATQPPKMLRRRRMPRSLGRPLGGLLTFAAVMVGWVFFRSADFSTALRMLESMISPSHSLGWTWTGDPNLTKISLWFAVSAMTIAAAIAFLAPNSLAITTSLKQLLEQQSGQQLTFGWVAAYGLLLGICIIFLGRVSPFLYFQF